MAGIFTVQPQSCQAEQLHQLLLFWSANSCTAQVLAPALALLALLDSPPRPAHNQPPQLPEKPAALWWQILQHCSPDGTKKPTQQ
jgi:hypothetical protein